MSDKRPARLGPICCVTVTAPNLDAVEEIYTTHLDYRVSGRGRVDEALSHLWSTPALDGTRYLLLGPVAGDECILRFVEAPADPAFVPFSSWGWNAAEIMVEDVDALARRLSGSPFEIVGEPQNLSFTDDIRAMQILGPGRELLYLTEFRKPVPGIDTPPTRCPVDRVFIVILGGPEMDGMQSFYAEQFGTPRAPVMESRVKGMSAAFGNSPEHRYPIAALPLAGRNLIEVDEMPPESAARGAPDGSLPAGIAMVSFVAPGAGGVAIERAEAPYRDADGVSCVRGPAGELIELVDRG